MRKGLAGLLALMLLFTAAACAAEESETKALDMAFGLFSIDLPGDAQLNPGQAGYFSMLEYGVSCFAGPVRANFDQKEQYDQTAGQRLGSYLSYVYAIIGGEGYTETPVQEETLENGIGLRWQLMRGEAYHALWFETETENMIYNLCLLGKPEQETTMLRAMRSFRVNAAMEKAYGGGLAAGKCEKGLFESVEGGLVLSLSEEWKPVENPLLLLPETSLVLEKNNGEWLIQLFYMPGIPQESTRELLNMLVEQRKPLFGSTFGEPYSLHLEGLGVDAWVCEEENDAQMINIAFVHQGYGYWGAFMWMKHLEDEARPVMLEALRTMTLP